MDLLKKIFPISWKFKDSGKNLAIGIVVYLLLAIVGGLIIGLLAHIPVVSIFTGILGLALDLYALVGIILEVLLFAKVIKD